MSITVIESSKVTVPGSTEVTVPDTFVFELDGIVVGRLHAKYDFKDLHPELHQAAINALQRHRYYIPVAQSVPEPEPDPEDTLEEPIVKESWLESLRRRFW